MGHEQPTGDAQQGGMCRHWFDVQLAAVVCVLPSSEVSFSVLSAACDRAWSNVWVLPETLGYRCLVLILSYTHTNAKVPSCPHVRLPCLCVSYNKHDGMPREFPTPS
jgi:hypothetical protein